MSTFHFLRPAWLLAVPPLLLLLAWLWRRQVRSRSWQAVCDPELLPHLLLGRSRRRANWPLWLLLAGSLLALLALAGPAWRKQPQPLFRQQSALVVLLDLSRSMNAADLKPSRLERARLKVEDLLNLRREGQTALVAFAGDAFVVTPLTDDTNTIRALLQSLDPTLMPVQGSEPQRAVRLGLQLLQQAGLRRGRLLLMTDDDRPERAMTAVRDLQQRGYTLSVLGVGTPDGAPIPTAGGGFFKDGGGDLVLAKLDEPGLRRLAAAGGGEYRRLTVGDGDLQGLLSGLQDHRLDQAETAAKTGVRWREEGVWLLWPLLLIGALAFRRGWLLVLALVLLQPLPAQALTWSELWQRPDQRGAAAFEAGDYRQAGQLFDDSRWRASALYREGRFREAAEALGDPQNADDWYNRGNALARDGQLPQALQAYEKALELQPEHEDARFNKDAVQKALQQPQNQPPQGNQSQADGQNQPSGEQPDRGGQNGKGNDQGQGSPQKAEHQNAPQDDGGAGSQKPGADSANQGGRGEAEPSAPGQQPPAPQAQDASAGTAADQADQAEQADQKVGQAAAAQDEEGDASGRAAQAAATSDETSAQADRQWLRRIPDDPGGLMRRKFLYQYRQRGEQLETDRPW